MRSKRNDAQAVRFSWGKWSVARVLQFIVRPLSVSGSVVVGRGLHLGLGSRIWSAHGLKVGDGVYIGRHCSIEVDGTIGNHVLIGNNVGVVGRLDHDYREIGTPITEAGWVGNAAPRAEDSVAIGDDVWVGFGAVVLGGVSIGRGAIVGAGAVVAHDVEAYSIVVGNPAALAGRRFTEDEIIRHEGILRLRD